MGIVPAKHLGGFNPTRKLLERTSSRSRIFSWALFLILCLLRMMEKQGNL